MFSLTCISIYFNLRGGGWATTRHTAYENMSVSGNTETCRRPAPGHVFCFDSRKRTKRFAVYYSRVGIKLFADSESVSKPDSSDYTS